MERYEPELNGHKLQRRTVLKTLKRAETWTICTAQAKDHSCSRNILFFPIFFKGNLKRKNLNKSEMTKLFFTESLRLYNKS